MSAAELLEKLRSNLRGAVMEMGHVALYAEARIYADEKNRIGMAEIWTDYIDWCSQHHYVPLQRGVFTEELVPLLASAGVPVRGDCVNTVFAGIRLG